MVRFITETHQRDNGVNMVTIFEQVYGSCSVSSPFKHFGESRLNIIDTNMHANGILQIQQQIRSLQSFGHKQGSKCCSKLVHNTCFSHQFGSLNAGYKHSTWLTLLPYLCKNISPLKKHMMGQHFGFLQRVFLLAILYTSTHHKVRQRPLETQIIFVLNQVH